MLILQSGVSHLCEFFLKSPNFSLQEGDGTTRFLINNSFVFNLFGALSEVQRRDSFA